MAIGNSITSATAGSVLFAGAAGILQQDNANLFWDNTNNRLGIGTTTPSTNLNILGGNTDVRVSLNTTTTSNARGGFSIYRGASGAGEIAGIVVAGEGNHYAIGTAPNDLIIFNYDAALVGQKIHFGTGSSPTVRMTIDNVGSVSIGTISASARLHVRGSGTTSATNSLLVENSTGTNNALVVRDDGNVGIGTASPGRILEIFGTNTIILTKSITNSGAVGFEFISKNAAGTAQTWQVGQNYALNSADFEIRDVTGSVSALTVLKGSGNVGIGTTSTSARLHVRGSGATSATFGLRVEDSGGTANVLISDAGNVTIKSGTAYGLISGGNMGIFPKAVGMDLYGDTAPSVNASYFSIYGRSSTATSGTVYGIDLGGIAIGSTGLTFAAAAGSANFRPLNIAYTINNSGAQTGTATGVFLNATETALNSMTHNLMDLQVAGTSKFKVDNSGIVTSTNVIRLKGYTVATLPSGTQGDTAFATDLLTPSYLGAAVGGGAVVATVFYNGAA